ncbi:uncharacterized protein PgNI_09344 [Pyricularia grisea]|uniref:DUF6536 domain-containing protein n=1 Tax=Pyricularia grisea TaxID=148305 RepID=A0A6P8ASY4_PYRGI|nr:uncharacterized protein PgNI_09344 [Pyricularia grisea]TLD05234.1 hypothetical protein PgNI_09344 [Pyricularia grisea]
MDPNQCRPRRHLDVRNSFPFARKEILREYIPELDPDNERAQTLRVRMSKRSNMLRLQFGLTAVVVIANTAVAIWAYITFPPDARGVGTLKLGDCDDVGTLNSGLHLLINVLSSLFLGAGNYCMQTLAAPTRAEMDLAHSRGHSLDVGVPSIRNLKRIARYRAALWLLLGVLSTLLHLIWNSVVFTSFPVVSYPVAMVSSDWRETFNMSWGVAPLPYSYTLDNYNPNGDWDRILDMQSRLANFTRLERKACLTQFADYRTQKAPLAVVALNVTSEYNRGYSLLHGWGSDWASGTWLTASWWICDVYNPANRPDWQPCDERLVDKLKLADEWVYLAFSRVEKAVLMAVDYCLVGPARDMESKCGLHYGSSLFVAVVSATFVESLLVLVLWRQSMPQGGRRKRLIGEVPTPQAPAVKDERGKSMVLMGDAIASYLRYPGQLPRHVEMEVQKWETSSRITWFSTVSPTTWMVSLSYLAIGIGFPLYLIISSIKYTKQLGFDTSMAGIWLRGLKSISPSLLAFRTGDHEYPLLACVIMANAFQVWISLLYVVYNNILTRQLVADEWMRFLRGPAGKKPLRVSQPEGMQRSNYTLSLPFAYSVPLMVALTALHWLVSQAIFLVQTLGFDTAWPDPRRVPSFDHTAVGHSHLGEVLALMMGGVMIVALLVNSFARYHQPCPPGLPGSGVDSALIRAFCSRPARDVDADIFPVRLGVVQNTDAWDGHSGPPTVVFSTYTRIEKPVSDASYLLPRINKPYRTPWRWLSWYTKVKSKV